MKVSEFRDLDVDELRQREKEMDDQLFRLRIQKSMGQLEAAAQAEVAAPRPRAREDGAEREGAAAGNGGRRQAQITGVVVSDKMEKSVVVAVERQVRDALYGKTQRRTSKFIAHNEANDAKVGDRSPSSRAGR